MGQTHYDVLGLAFDARSEDIRRAYRSLALKHHPDKSKLPDAKEQFQTVLQAFESLYDPASRLAYDASLKHIHVFTRSSAPKDEECKVSLAKAASRCPNLCEACQRADFDGIEIILAASTDMETTVLSSAIFFLINSKIDIAARGFCLQPCMKLLLDARANPNAHSRFGSLLCVAAQAGSAVSVCYLLEMRADIHACSRIQRGSDPNTSSFANAIWAAAAFANPRCVRILLDGAADVHSTDESGTTLLMLAAENLDFEMTEDLLNAGVLLGDHENPLVKKGPSSLMRAVKSSLRALEADEEIRRPSTVELLLQHRADPNECDHGITALQICAQKNMLATASTLLYFKANPHQRDRFGRSALDMVASHEMRELLTGACEDAERLQRKEDFCWQIGSYLCRFCA